MSADVKFRKITRILISGRVQLCREVFGETLNDSRDPEGLNERYTSRFFLKHAILEQAFDCLAEANFKIAGSSAISPNLLNTSDQERPILDDETKWLHYNEYVFVN